MKAGYLGPKHNYKGPDAEATEILFDQMAARRRRAAVKPGHGPAVGVPRPRAVAPRARQRLDARRARRATPTPTLTLRSAFEDFVDLGAGRADPRRLMLARKIRPKGDLRLLLKLPKVFGCRRASSVAM